MALEHELSVGVFEYLALDDGHGRTRLGTSRVRLWHWKHVALRRPFGLLAYSGAVEWVPSRHSHSSLSSHNIRSTDYCTYNHPVDVCRESLLTDRPKLLNDRFPSTAPYILGDAGQLLQCNQDSTFQFKGTTLACIKP